MASNSMITVYLGAGEEGMKLYEEVKKAADKDGITVSTFVKNAILKELK